VAGQLELQVLGCAGGYPYDGVACSGYLVSAQGQTVLLDCGPGVAMRLLGRMRATDLGGIVLSHLHPDHLLDLIPLGYAAMTEWIALGRMRRIPLFMPLGGHAFLARLSDPFAHRAWRLDGAERNPGLDRLRDALRSGRDWLFEVFDLTEFTAGDRFAVGPLWIDSCAARHTPEAACLATGEAGARLVYTADTLPFPDLASFCRAADLLLCEAHFSGAHPPGGAHMTPQEAGDLARSAGVSTLMLTHLAARSDAPGALAAAAARFGGPVHCALDFLAADSVVSVGRP